MVVEGKYVVIDVSMLCVASLQLARDGLNKLYSAKFGWMLHYRRETLE